MSPRKPLPSSRILQLDVLRAVAIFMVIAVHLDLGREHNVGLRGLVEHILHSPNDWAHLPETVARTAVRSGWMGVDLFFVLSGFLVSGLLFREYESRGRIHLGNFLVRRGFKIYPGFYVLLLATLLVFATTKVRTVTAGQAWCEALFLTNYGPNIWGHTWSLAVEEHFYLLLGLMLLCLSLRKTVRPFACFPVIVLTVASVVLGLRIATSLAFPEFDYKRHVFPTHLRLDSLLFGSLLSYYSIFEPDKFALGRHYRTPIFLISLVLVTPPLFVVQGNFWMRTVGLTGLYIGFGGLLVTFLSIPVSEARWLGPPMATLGRLGLHSYSIYLWHVPVVAVAIGLVGRLTGVRLNSWTEVVLYVGGSIGVGVAMAKLVEFPALSLREWLFPRPIRSVMLTEGGPSSEQNPGGSVPRLEVREKDAGSVVCGDLAPSELSEGVGA